MVVELEVIADAETPEMTGGVGVDVEMYSLAPMSYATPCGRLVPSMSSGTAESVTPVSIAGLPDCK
jgi:hypothetical protein